MGTNTLSTATDDNVIPASHHNELVTAFLQELVPRNANRAPGDIAGSLGTSLYRFLRLFVKEIELGEIASNLKIYEGAAGEIWIEQNDDILKLKDTEFNILLGATTSLSLDAAEFNVVLASVTRLAIQSNLFEVKVNSSGNSRMNYTDTTHAHYIGGVINQSHSATAHILCYNGTTKFLVDANGINFTYQSDQTIGHDKLKPNLKKVAAVDSGNTTYGGGSSAWIVVSTISITGCISGKSMYLHVSGEGTTSTNSVNWRFVLDGTEIESGSIPGGYSRSIFAGGSTTNSTDGTKSFTFEIAPINSAQSIELDHNFSYTFEEA